jgi:NhaA family Na+:H+ antiporter
MNKYKIYSLLPYLILGVVLWSFIHESELHATLAGVLTAALIPSRRRAQVEDVAAQTATVFEAEIERSRRQSNSPSSIGSQANSMLLNALEHLNEPGHHLKRGLENWSNFLILPLFAFFNTGINLTGGVFDTLSLGSLGIPWCCIKFRVQKLIEL